MTDSTFKSLKCEQVEQWLISSGIIDENGGVSAWYDKDRSQYSFYYPEISGYALIYTLGCYKQTSQRNYLELSLKIGNWLKGIAIDDKKGQLRSTVVRENACNDHSKQPYYSFDLSIVANAFNLLSQIDSNFQADAKRLLTSLKEELYNLEFRACSTDPTAEVTSWSSRPNMHHAKNLLAFLNSSDPAYSLPVDQLKKISTHYFVKYKTLDIRQEELHPYLYFLEGTIISAIKFDESQRLKWCKEALIKVLECHSATHELTSDVLTQTLRLSALLEVKHSHIESYRKEVEERICASLSKQENGGLSFWRIEKNKKTHLNSWATIFYLQYLQMINNDLELKYFA